MLPSNRRQDAKLGWLSGPYLFFDLTTANPWIKIKFALL